MAVLVVDDDPSIRLLCRVNLELEGHRVLEAETLEQALAQVHDADRVFLDLHIGGLRGRELLDPIRRARPDIPVVLLTGAADVPADLRAEVESVLAKPFTIDDLVAAAGGGSTGVM
jgi:CheY-like chemotaxis protein